MASGIVKHTANQTIPKDRAKGKRFVFFEVHVSLNRAVLRPCSQTRASFACIQAAKSNRRRAELYANVIGQHWFLSKNLMACAEISTAFRIYLVFIEGTL